MAMCCIARITICVVVVFVVVLSCGEVKADVITFGQEYSTDLDLLMSNQSGNVFLVYEVPTEGILYQMSAYFMTRQSMYLQVWRPTGNPQEFELIFMKQYATDEVNQVKVLDTVIDPQAGDPECPEVEVGDWLGVYSSGQVPIPYYRNADFQRILHQVSRRQPTLGQKLVFQELRPAGKLRFVVQFSLSTEDSSEETSNRRPHGRWKTGSTNMCILRNRVMPGWMTMNPTSRPPGGSTLRPNNDGTRQGNATGQGNNGLSPTMMYILIGALAFVVIAVILGIIICVACRRKKRQAEPRSPVPPLRLDGALLQMSKNKAFLGDSPRHSPDVRYTSDKQLPPKLQNIENEYLDLNKVDKSTDEVYEEIVDPEERDSRPVKSRLPLPARPHPDRSPSPSVLSGSWTNPSAPGSPGISPRMGSRLEPPGNVLRSSWNASCDRSPRIRPTSRSRNPSGSESPGIVFNRERNPSGSGSGGIDARGRPTSVIGARPLRVQDVNNEHTYLSLVG